MATLEPFFIHHIVILFSLFRFNAYKALYSLLVSAISHLFDLHKEDLDSLKTEASRFHHSNNKTNELSSMENLDNFMLEMFRLFPPATFVFRRVTQNFVMTLKTGNYQLHKDDLLCGNIYLSQRDPEIFKNPDTMDMNRFKRQPNLKDYLTCFGVSYGQESTPDIHKCAGQKLALTFAKLFITHFLSVDVEFASKPTWTGKKIKRFIGTDKPVKVKTFRYTRDK